jgi:hypothetical protein
MRISGRQYVATDYTKYQIVQITEADWAVKYSDGTLESGFETQQSATDYATDQASSQTSVEYFGVPRNLEEAIVQAQEARDSYRSFVADTVNPTQEEVDSKLADITTADTYVSTYQQQLENSRKNNPVYTDTELDIDSQIATADITRKAASEQAAAVNADSTSTDEEKSEATARAFEAETYYESLVAQKTSSNNSSNSSSTSTYSSITQTLSSIFNNTLSSSTTTTTQSGSSGTSVNTTITDKSSALFGNITTINGNNSVTTASASGSTSYSGTTLYDTSRGGVLVNSTTDKRIKLKPKSSMQSMLSGVLEPLSTTGGLLFPYTPQITVNNQVSYQDVILTHSNNNYQTYQNTNNVAINISAKFTAQNTTEAKYFLAAIHFLRAVSKMHFGQDDENKGLPPPQLFLSGYGPYFFNDVSVIILNYDLTLDDDVDYVEAQGPLGISMVPAYGTINIQLSVQQTPNKARTFNWDKFATGELMQDKGWL